MNSSTVGNQSEPVKFVNDICFGPGLTTMIAICFVVGIASNAIVVDFARSKLKKRSRPDKILILNMACTNLVALCLSLPLHYFDLQIVPYFNVPLVEANALCLVR